MFAGNPLSNSGTGMSRERPEVVADNEDPGDEPEGFWDPIHEQVALWVESDEAA